MTTTLRKDASTPLPSEIVSEDKRAREHRRDALTFLIRAERVHRQTLKLELDRAKNPDTTELGKQLEVDFAASEDREGELVLERNREQVPILAEEKNSYLHGLVYDSDRKPVADHRIVLVENGNVAKETKSDAHGYFVFKGPSLVAPAKGKQPAKKAAAQPPANAEPPKGGPAEPPKAEPPKAEPPTFALRALDAAGKVAAHTGATLTFGVGPSAYHELVIPLPPPKVP